MYLKQIFWLLQAYGEGSDLVSVSNKEEHGFLTRYLHENDPLQLNWYTSGYQKTSGFWENEGDGSSFQDMMEAILPDQATSPRLNFLAYRLASLWLIMFKCYFLCFLKHPVVTCRDFHRILYL